jgi:predicted ATPase
MLDAIRLKNFKGLRNFEMKPGKLNVLVGPNDVGKTSFLEAIEMFSLFMKTGSIPRIMKEEHSFDEIRWKGDSSSDISFEFRGNIGGMDFETGLSINQTHSKKPFISDDYLKCLGKVVFNTNENGRLVSGAGARIIDEQKRHDPGLFIMMNEPEVSPVFNFFSSSEAFQVRPSEAKRPVPMGTDKEIRLDVTGAGLARVLDYLHRKKRSSFTEIERTLIEIIPDIKEITFNQTEVWGEDGHTVLDGHTESTATQPRLVKKTGVSLGFAMKKGWEIPAVHISDGVILFLTYLTIVHFSSEVKPGAILADEPENGIHPKRVQEMLKFFRALPEGLGSLPPVQVFLTTHSPYLVDYLEPEEVHMIYRDEKGGAACKRMDEIHNIERFLEDQYLGEVWFNVGEGGLLGRSGNDG